MIRHVSAVALALCLNTVSLAAQTAELQTTEITVKTAPADVHKSPTTASAVVGKAPIGTVLDIKRSLGSWVQVPWPAGEGGIAYLHVNTGTIARRMTPIANGAALGHVTGTGSAPGAQCVGQPDQSRQRSRIESSPTLRQSRTDQSSNPAASAQHGMGARMKRLTPGFGAGFGVSQETGGPIGRRCSSSTAFAARQPARTWACDIASVLRRAFCMRCRTARQQLWSPLRRRRRRQFVPDDDQSSAQRRQGPSSENGLGSRRSVAPKRHLPPMPQVFGDEPELGYRWSQVSNVGLRAAQARRLAFGSWYLK